MFSLTSASSSPFSKALLTASQLSLLATTILTSPAAANSRSSSSTVRTHFEKSSLYDWGWYGAYPQVEYQSFGAYTPAPNLLQQNDQCYDGYTFIEPRGLYVDTPGPIILDNDGNLIWTQTQWGQAMDVKVQKYQGKNYITFWHGTDNGTFGEGYYLMLDETYQVAKKITPVGNLTGDLHEFRITEQGTALMTIYEKMQIDMSGYNIPKGWIFDSIFQEIDLATGNLLFEWRASDHYRPHESLAPLGNMGRASDKAFDYFHINAIDKDADGNYIISSRYLCSVTCISGKDGSIIWQLGGTGNQFIDLSNGQATDFAWNHHAAWFSYENKTLTIFDNASNGYQKSAKYSRGLMIELDMDAMTATLVHAYVAPQKILAPSQGSVQPLPNGNVLVGWGHTPAWTEYTMEGEVLCDTHVGPFHLAMFGWVKNYRTFKYEWVGRPIYPPDVAIRPDENALYVSWNGATEVRGWLVQSATHQEAEDDEFMDHGPPVLKQKFETRIPIPADADEFVRVLALDVQGDIIGYSDTYYRDIETTLELLEAPSRGAPIDPRLVLVLGIFSGLVGIFLVRALMRRKGFRPTRYLSGITNIPRKGLNRLLRRNSVQHKYEALPGGIR